MNARLLRVIKIGTNADTVFVKTCFQDMSDQDFQFQVLMNGFTMDGGTSAYPGKASSERGAQAPSSEEPEIITVSRWLVRWLSDGFIVIRWQ